MAESDRQRLLERALELPRASEGDFFGGRRPPPGADPAHLRIVKDTALRTRLIEARVAEGLQSPKGPQKIASIIRVYPGFDAPQRSSRNGRASGERPARTRGARTRAAAPVMGLPTVDEMESLIARFRTVEREVAGELSAQIDARIEELKHALARSSGAELETQHRDLGEALQRKRALAAQIRHETFARIERDASFAPRVHLRLLAR
jgi:hypothetical protein